MPSAERRARAKDNLRRAILDAARELFATEDYKAVSMRRIAEKIDYSATAIYLHFKDKEEILFHLIEEGFEMLTGQLEAITIDDPIERLREGARVYFHFAFTQPHYYRLMFQLEDSGLADRMMPCVVGGPRAFQFILDAVRLGFERGVIRRYEPEEEEVSPLVTPQVTATGSEVVSEDVQAEVTASVIWAHIHGAVALSLSGHIGVKLPASMLPHFQRAVVDTTLHGILASSL